MNEISLKLFWCVVQVTIVCASASLIALLLRRCKRIPLVRMLQASLTLVFLLTVLSMSPWPRWGSISENTVSIIDADPVPSELLTQSPQLAEPPMNPHVNGTQSQAESWVQRWQPTWRAAAGSIKNAGHVASPWVLPLFAFSMFIGSTRLMVGCLEIRRLRRTSTRVADKHCNEMFRDLQDRSRLMHVDLRVHADLSAPATIGWQRPLVLLPNDWQSWTNDELRSVLAHELAHITRHDFRTLVAAHFVALFHFYHPLVHSLVSNLRLEQEMAADAAAAKLAGGRERYMSSIASLALRLDNRSVTWPLRCFLPTRGDFLRRIEMLKNPLPVVRSNFSSVGVACTLLILVIGITAAGFRPQSVLAQAVEKQEASVVDDKDAESAREQSGRHAHSIGLAMHNYFRQHGSLPPAVIVGPSGVKHSWRVAILPQLGYTDLYNKYNFDEPWDSAGNKKLLNLIPDVYRAADAEKDSSDASWFAVVGEGTAFGSDEGHQFEDFTDGTSNTLLVVESKLSIPWSQPKDIEYSEKKPLPKLGGIHKGGFMSVFVDGAAHFIMDEVEGDVLRNVILRADGSVLDHKELHPERYPRKSE